ncbi:hypothetical protein ABT095_06950 [Kitasatospora sp. NPDC002227]|uniref:hypothetical protein n=1 Tax=Kitasatospora sp. NPDC002227 TaxID=3154773 RepID=UPI003322D75E
MSIITARVRAAGLALGLALGTTVLAATGAHAQSVTSGSLSFSGDDWIGGGQSYNFTTDNKDQLNVSASDDHRSVEVSVNGAQGDWWTLDLVAPTGSQLTPGTYQATRSPFNGAGAGLSLFGDGRGCNTLTGNFTVTNIVFGPHGYVQTLDASFEEHCEGGTAGTTGQVHIANPTPPPVLTLGLGVSVNGTASTVDGKAAINGTVTCNKPTTVAVNGAVSQLNHKTIVRGVYSATVDCVPGAPVTWTVKADPSGTVPFQQGDASVTAQASAPDADYNTYETASATVVTHLTKTRG